MFSWDGLKVNNTGVISTYDFKEGKSGGIDHYVGNASHAPESLRPLVDYSQTILKDVEKRSWAFLGATAGMRLLNETNPTAAKDIMGNVTNYLKSQPVRYGRSSIISGIQEAIDGWIAVNYLKHDISSKPTKTSVGSLDFGGASLEIAFADKPDSHHTADYWRVKLYNQTHEIYAHSYLCFGRDQMELKFLTNLSLQNYTIQNPCYPRDYVKEVQTSDLWKKPCVATSAPAGRKSIVIKGSGDPSKCSELVDQLFELTPCSSKPCGINGTYQPPVNGTYYGTGLLKFVLGSVYKVSMLNSTSPKEWDVLRDSIHKDCNKTLKELKEKYSGIQDRFLHSLCFDGMLALSTLEKGLNFSLNSATPWSIDFTGVVDTVSIDWPLGYMLRQTVGIASPTKPYGYDHLFTTLDVVLSVVLLTIVAVILLLLFLASVRVFKLMLPSRRAGYAALD
jgi:hypothetical protein